jgi:Mn-dependent DtxR family transcriptional regulator
MLPPTKLEILKDLQVNGDNVPANIAENIDRHPKYVTRSLTELEDDGYVINKGRGVYTLSPDGREVARSQ